MRLPLCSIRSRPDDVVTFLSLVGPAATRNDLSIVLAGSWEWKSTYGDELYLKLLSLNIQPPKSLPSKPRVTAVKRGTQTVKGETTEMMKNTKSMKHAKMMASKKAGQHMFEVNGYTASQVVGGSLDPTYSTFSTFASGNHSQAHPHMSVWAPEVQASASNEDCDVHRVPDCRGIVTQ
jgi:hypothetical protein